MTVLIHFDATCLHDALSDNTSVQAARRPGSLNPFEWYCQWASQRTDSLFVLVPEDLKDRSQQVVSHLKDASPLWYAEHTPLTLPDIGRKEQVWCLNGDHHPLVDWHEAASVARREDTDVVVFGPSDSADVAHYRETVAVNDAGEVLRFSRDYSDSPEFTDSWTGSASFLVTASEHAPAVMRHILRCGWGLDSIGALTRRFSIRWSTDSCLASCRERTQAQTGCDTNGNSELAVSIEELKGDCRRATPTFALTLATPHEPIRPVGSDDSYTQEEGYTAANGAGPVRHPSAGGGEVSLDRDHNGTLTGGDTGHDTDLQLIAGVDPPTLPQADRAYLLAKRITDVLLAAVGLILLLPVLAVAAVAVKLTSSGPILFGDKRQGVGGREFVCWKFRTMFQGAQRLQDQLRKCNEVDGPQFKIAADPRLTTIGALFRRYNIDELPQIANVLLGQMSFVGPRPSPDHENQMCPGWRRARLSLKPGITGLWQIMRARDTSDSDFQEWIYYDVEYARHRSMWLDTQILLHTPLIMFAPRLLRRLPCVLQRRGICIHAGRLSREHDADTVEQSGKRPVSRLNRV